MKFADLIWRLTFLSLAGGFVPLTYLVTCAWLYKQRANKLTYVAYFVLFGLVGGACLSLALSPSGLTALCIIFLITVGSVGCLASSLSLQALRSRSRLESIAMILGYCYSGLFAFLWICTVIH